VPSRSAVSLPRVIPSVSLKQWRSFSRSKWLMIGLDKSSSPDGCHKYFTRLIMRNPSVIAFLAMKGMTPDSNGVIPCAEIFSSRAYSEDAYSS
jgi:hypothetical protein